MLIYKKNVLICKKNAEKFVYMKKMQYFCSRFRRLTLLRTWSKGAERDIAE